MRVPWWTRAGTSLTAVNGHWFLPAGGHEISPAVATRFPQGRPREFPGHGQVISQVVGARPKRRLLAELSAVL